MEEQKREGVIYDSVMLYSMCQSVPDPMVFLTNFHFIVTLYRYMYVAHSTRPSRATLTLAFVRFSLQLTRSNIATSLHFTPFLGQSLSSVEHLLLHYAPFFSYANFSSSLTGHSRSICPLPNHHVYHHCSKSGQIAQPKLHISAVVARL